MKASAVERNNADALGNDPVASIIIQPCPEVLLELRKEVAKGDPDPAVVARIAGSDVALAAALLRTANSPLYARSRSAATVAQAVSMLGMMQTLTILTGFLLRRSIAVTSPLIAHFWETSSHRATAMGFIAQQMPGVNADIANNCGLFCHVGMAVLAQGLKGYEHTLMHAIAEEERGFTEIENTAHRTDHAVVGAIVAKTWHLPPIIAMAIRMHHDFTILHDDSTPKEVRTLVAMLLVADHLVCKFEGVKDQREWQQYGGACLDFLDFNEDQVDAWSDALQPMFAGVLD